MKIKIEHVSSSKAEHRVRFASACGSGEGAWSGPTPGVGDEREVELTVDENFIAGIDLVVSAAPIGLHLEDAQMVLIGRVALVDGDYVRLDLGCGGLDVEVKGAAPLAGEVCRLETRTLKLFDTCP